MRMDIWTVVHFLRHRAVVYFVVKMVIVLQLILGTVYARRWRCANHPGEGVSRFNQLRKRSTDKQTDFFRQKSNTVGIPSII